MPPTLFAVLRQEVGYLMIIGLGNAGIGKACLGVSDHFDGFHPPSAMATDNKVAVRPRAFGFTPNNEDQRAFLRPDPADRTPQTVDSLITSSSLMVP